MALIYGYDPGSYSGISLQLNAITGYGATFTANSGGGSQTIDEVQLRLRRVGSPTADVNIALFAASAGTWIPNYSSQIGSYLNVDSSTVTASFGQWSAYDVSALSWDIPNDGERFCLVIEFPEGDGTNAIQVERHGSDVNANNRMIQTNTSSDPPNTGWTDTTATELYVQLNGILPSGIVLPGSRAFKRSFNTIRGPL